MFVMDPFHFSCPHCFSRLRVRDPLSVGREVDCPECGKFLLVVEQANAEGQRELHVTSAPEPTPLILDIDRPARPDLLRDPNSMSSRVRANRPNKMDARATGPRASSGPNLNRQSPSASERLPIPQTVGWRRPFVVAWLITGGCAAILLGYVFLNARGSSSHGPPASDGANVPPDAAADVSDIGVAEKRAGAAEVETAGAVAQTRQRMERLGTILLDSLDTEAAFPPGTSPAPNLAPHQRLSWQALLADRFADRHPPVAWDHAWNDPLNDPFVRRRLHEFQNPVVKALTGGDGYPATHYVGVAGVGDDAASLSAGDPRAGIFGDNRRTRLSEIRDGTSNTWLTLGVQMHLGSWAAGGRSTVRPLTREPYVNGPDGFGTGSADSMLALLADGSVRVVSAATDPRLLRSLAAMADGPPGESPEAGEEVAARAGHSAPAIGTLIPLTSDFNDGDDQPLEPEFAPEPLRREIDLAKSLRQPILLYDLPRSRPLYEWLPGVADLIGAPIRFDNAELGAAVAGLKTPVRLRLENTTVGEILDGLLKPAGLTYRVETDHIQLAPRK